MANARPPKIREKAVKSRASKIAQRGALGVLLRGCASCRGVGGRVPILNFALFVKFRVGMLLAAGSSGLRLGLWLALALEIEPGAPS